MKPFIFALVCMSLLAVNGCKVKPPADNLQVKPAPIHEVSISFAESYPVQVFVYIQGGLSDGCTSFKEVKTTRSGTVFDIEVTVQRPADQMCAQIYGYFEQNISLGTDFVTGRTYTVIINDVTKTFVMQ